MRNVLMSEKFNIVAISSFAADEPIYQIFAAANTKSIVTFYFTENCKHLKKETGNKKPVLPCCVVLYQSINITLVDIGAPLKSKLPVGFTQLL